jgi:hypothetical protein
MTHYVKMFNKIMNNIYFTKKKENVRIIHQYTRPKFKKPFLTIAYFFRFQTLSVI